MEQNFSYKTLFFNIGTTMCYVFSLVIHKRLHQFELIKARRWRNSSYVRSVVEESSQNLQYDPQSSNRYDTWCYHIVSKSLLLWSEYGNSSFNSVNGLSNSTRITPFPSQKTVHILFRSPLHESLFWFWLVMVTHVSSQVILSFIVVQ